MKTKLIVIIAVLLILAATSAAGIHAAGPDWQQQIAQAIADLRNTVANLDQRVAALEQPHATIPELGKADHRLVKVAEWQGKGHGPAQIDYGDQAGQFLVYAQRSAVDCGITVFANPGNTAATLLSANLPVHTITYGQNEATGTAFLPANPGPAGITTYGDDDCTFRVLVYRIAPADQSAD